MTVPQPRIKARGRLRPGSRISPPVNVTLFQADCENKGPIIARPRSIASASPPVARKPGWTTAGSQPLAAGSHQDEVQAAAFGLRPQARPTTIRPSNAAVLV